MNTDKLIKQLQYAKEYLDILQLMEHIMKLNDWQLRRELKY